MSVSESLLYSSATLFLIRCIKTQGLAQRTQLSSVWQGFTINGFFSSPDAIGIFQDNKTKQPASAEIFTKDKKIEILSEFKYLGEMLDSNLNFRSDIKKLI